MTERLEAGDWAMPFSTGIFWISLSSAAFVSELMSLVCKLSRHSAASMRRDSLPRSFPRWRTNDPWRPEGNLPGKPVFKGQTGKQWRVADPHWPPQSLESERTCAYHKEEPPVDIFLQLASVSRAGVKACDVLHAGPLSMHPDPHMNSQARIHDHLGSGLETEFPALRWQNHVNPRTPFKGMREELLHQGTVNDVCFAPDDSVLATAGRDKSVRLWEPLTMKPLRVFSGHDASVNAVSFSRDGRVLASASGSSWEHDNSLRLWDVTQGVQKDELLGHTGAVSSVHFASAGSHQHLVASASHDCSVRLWDTRDHLGAHAFSPPTHIRRV